MVILLTVLILGTIALRVANPQIVRLFIDAAQRKADLNEMFAAGAVFLAFAVVVQILSVAAIYVGERVGWTATNNLRADLALHCMRLDMTFHNNKTPGEMVERVDGDVMDLSIFFSQMVIQVLGSALLMVAVLVALAFESWQAALATTILTVVAILTMEKARALAVPFWTIAREAHAELYGFLEEQMGGMEDIRSSGAGAFTLRGLYVAARKVIRTESKAGVVGIWMWVVWCFWEALGRAFAFIVVWLQWSAGSISLGTGILLVFYVETMFTPLRLLVQQMEHFQKAAASIVRVRDLLAIQTKIGSGGLSVLPSGPLGVRFDRVTFGYNAEAPVLTNVSFSLQPGHVLGVLGRTGSGKTTLARLIFRLYDVADGSVSLSGQGLTSDVRQLSLPDLPSRVAMVTQDVQVFRASIRNNFTLFDDTVTDDRLFEVIADMGLNEWFARQPNGLDTEMESGGKNLSAGEAQLLAFGRVFLRNPGLVVMDEASSRLDPLTEARIEHAVDRLLGGSSTGSGNPATGSRYRSTGASHDSESRSALIIAHRVTTVMRADDILIIENGNVAEYGPREALQADEGSLFSRLLRTAEIQEVLA